jgi:hypothetical protein
MSTNFPRKSQNGSLEDSMSTPGFGLSGPQQSSLTNLVEQKLRAERVVKVGAGWFLTIAALSLVNSVLSMSGAHIRFIFGLGLAEFVDVLAHQAGQTGFALDLVINGFVAGVFVLAWNFARKGERWAFMAGMALYAVDALVMLYFKDILAVAFHAYGLYRIYTGMNGIPALQKLQQALTPAGAPIQPV